MDLTALAAALLRRWYAVALGLLVTAGLGFVAFAAVPPSYSAAGTVLLLPPSEMTPAGSNQLLQLGGLEQPASLVVAFLAGDDVRESVAAAHPGVTYDIVLDPLARGPLINVTVEAPSSDTAMAGLDAVLAGVPTALETLQDQVEAPRDSRVSSMPLTVDVEATTVTKATLRALIAAVGVGLALTFAGAMGLDGLMLRRQESRRAQVGAQVSAPAPAERFTPASASPTAVVVSPVMFGRDRNRRTGETVRNGAGAPGASARM